MSLDVAQNASGPLQPGTRFGKFDVRQRIGQGGYASVYHAFDTILHRDVAIKVLHRAGGVTDDMLRRGVVEAQLMCQLRHQNIVHVYDANITDDGQLYLVMELLVGRTLWQVLRRYERLAVEEACSLAIQIADAVEVAHQRGAIHRDLKPENVFITEGNVAKVLDFGIAKVMHGAKGHTTRPDAVHGTVLYMSPEQIAGQELTGRCDIYALGNILFEMLYGKHPCLLKNPDIDALAVAWLQTYEIPPALDSIAPYCPRHLARIVSQAMSKRAAERFASMKELRDALETSRSRFLTESGGGELKGRARDLSGVTESSKPSALETGKPGAFESQAPGRFPWFSRSTASVIAAMPRPPQAPPAAELQASGSTPGSQVDRAGAGQVDAQVADGGLVEASQVEASPIEARPQTTPLHDPSPIALQVAAREPLRAALPGRRRRIPVPVIAALWAGSMAAGFGVSVWLTQRYLEHKRGSAQTAAAHAETPLAAPNDATAVGARTAGAVAAASAGAQAPADAVGAIREDSEHALAAAETGAAPSSILSATAGTSGTLGTPGTSASKTIAKPATRAATTKTKKLDASEARLRALEEKLNKGTLGTSSGK